MSRDEKKASPFSNRPRAKIVRLRFTVCQSSDRVESPRPQSRSEGKHERNADNEEEEGKNQVGWSPPVPFRVPERPIGSTVSGIVDQDHGRDGGSAKDVQRHQPR